MKNFLKLLFSSALAAAWLGAASSPNPQPDERFKTDLLVVVAHPDDETEIGAYLARAIFDEKKRVAVVFGTRGNGGGNAEGQEQAAALGAIREIEGRRALEHFGVMNVWFLNGLDTPSQDVLQSLETWNHGDSLGRLVRIVRLTRPSVIATWLPDWVAGENHGDHQASSVLANEAFDMAGDPTAFPEQLAAPRNRTSIGNLTEGLRPWQPEKIYFFSDAAHTEFLEGKGPQYVSKETSPARGISYARLGLEECAFHLTQGDSGQECRAALEKNDLKGWDDPVRFIFGKSHVESGVTADLFAGVQPNGIPFERAPGYSAPAQPAQPALDLGGPWRFYRAFWQAHGLEHLANLVPPEIMVQPGSRMLLPFVIENPSGADLDVDLTAHVPTKWEAVRGIHGCQAPAHGSCSMYVRAVVPELQTDDWQNVTVTATAGEKTIGSVDVRVKISTAAMPE